MDGFSAAKEGAQRYQDLPPAACASDFETIEREDAQRTDSSRTARAHIQRPPPARYQHRHVRKYNRIITAALHKPSTSTSPDHNKRPRRIRATRAAYRSRGRLYPGRRYQHAIEERLHNMYIATIDKARARRSARRQRVGRATKRRERTAAAHTNICARNNGEHCGEQRVRTNAQNYKRIKE